MDTLPYFLLLLKKNVLLCSIITNQSFKQVDLSQVEHISYSDHAVDFLNFSLGEREKFTSVNVIILEDDVSITFRTDNADYFNNSEYYFHRESTERVRRPFEIYGKLAQTRDKNMGEFTFLPPPTPPASIYVANSSVYGYTISVNFYKHNLPDAKPH